MLLRILFLCCLPLLALTGCSELQFGAALGKEAYDYSKPQMEGKFKIGRPYMAEGMRYYPQESYTLDESGIASWYGPGFHGKMTASGERFDTNELTAAHRTLQLPSLVRVTNLENGRSLIVRVNDRGPFSRGRIIDVSKKAAQLLGFIGRGTARVRIQVLPEESRMIAAAAKQGKDTKGVEVALNQGQGVPGHLQSASAAAPAGLAGHTTGGVFYPDPVVTQEPVTPTALYIQTGAYSVRDNARKQAEALRSFGMGVHVMDIFLNQEQLYRVRIGPLQDVAAADALLNKVLNGGYRQAVIVVDAPRN